MVSLRNYFLDQFKLRSMAVGVGESNLRAWIWTAKANASIKLAAMWVRVPVPGKWHNIGNGALVVMDFVFSLECTNFSPQFGFPLLGSQCCCRAAGGSLWWKKINWDSVNWPLSKELLNELPPPLPDRVLWATFTFCLLKTNTLPSATALEPAKPGTSAALGTCVL